MFLASPSLDERTAVWVEDPDSEAGRGIEAALVKYVARMAARCTPFGLFAGNTVGAIARETRLELLERDAAVRHTRLDMDLLSEVVVRLAADPAVRDRITFAANTSLYEVGGTLRYAESRLVDGRRAYFLVDVEPHEHLRRALERARGGATLEEVTRAIEDEEVPFDAARAFVDQLVDAQLLVPELGPVVTGPESVDDLIARLEGIEAAAAARDLLARTRDALVDMDAAGPGVEPARYRELAAPLAALAPVEPSHFVQVDLVKPAATVTVAEDLVDELLRGVQALADLFGRRVDPLEAFRRAFEERWGDREVPLVEALDEEIGIGFQAVQGPGADPSPLLAGLPFPPAEEEERIVWGSRGRFLAWKLAEAIAASAEELVLEPSEVARFRDASAPGLAASFHVLATILAPDPRDPDAPRAVLESAAGPSGVRLLGRFCHGDPELRARVEEHLRAEEALRPGVRYFEIVHLPEGRTGNILARPVLRELELAFLGASGAPPDRTLHVDDLVIAVRRNRVVLRSRSRGGEVRPRMTSAHNTYWRSLGIYRFLAALQAEGGVEGLMWSWGPLESQPRLPRVRLGRLVLARATWNARKEEIETLRTARDHDAFRAVQAWRARRGLPRWVGLVDADNVLPVDLDHPLSVAAFLDELRGREEIALQEMFPGARADAAVAPEGRFVNEVVIPVVRPPAEAPAPAAAGAGPAAAATATAATTTADAFPPGSEWLTVKLYTGPALADRVLEEVVAPAAAASLASGAVSRWFFLRYGDPDWHLRVRFGGDSARLLSEVVPALRETAGPLLADGRVHRVQLDTYVRETRRYGGGRGVVRCEEIFFRDSEAAVALLAEAAGDAGLDARWRFAFAGMDRLLDDLGLDLAAKRALAETLANTFGEELRLDSALRQRLRERYREERGALDALLDGRDDAAPWPSGFALLRARSDGVRAACEELRALAGRGELAVPLEDVAASLLHMHANRVLRSANRAQEMVLYRFLEKTYASRLARSRKAEEVGKR